MSEGHRWRPGDTMLVRNVRDRRVRYAQPMRVVEDRGDFLALYICPGTPVVVWGDAEGKQTREIAKAVRQIVVPWKMTHCLQLIREDDAHGSYVFWDEAWKFLGWYINFQEPFRRNALGIDTMDQTLDLEISSDRQKYRWKDEGEFQHGIEFGWYTPEMLDELKAYGLRIFEQARVGEPPFGDGWEHWRPDPEWGPVDLADGWDVIPPQKDKS